MTTIIADSEITQQCNRRSILPNLLRGVSVSVWGPTKALPDLMVWKAKVEEILYVFKVATTGKTEEQIISPVYLSSWDSAQNRTYQHSLYRKPERATIQRGSKPYKLLSVSAVLHLKRSINIFF